MSVTGIDVAWAQPSVAQIQATGAKWVARYFATDQTKILTAAHVKAYSAAGLGVVTVWESTAGRATAGQAAGAADAAAAEVQRRAAGLPEDMPIHFAVDEDTPWASVAPYFAGAASVIGRGRVGAYGGFAVIEGAAAAGYPYLWQTTAWSAGKWSAHATIRQTGGSCLSGSADYDQAVSTDFGQYPRPEEPSVPLTQADANLVAKTVLSIDGVIACPPDDPHAATNQFWALQSYIKDIDSQARAANAALAGLEKTVAAQTAAITALAAHVGSGADTAAIVAAVQQAIATAVVHVDVTSTES